VTDRLDGQDTVRPGRLRNGKFAPGNSGGPGRPSRVTERDFLAATVGACSVTDWIEVVVQAVVDAKAGDPQARAWLGKHLLPEPTGNRLHEMAMDAAAGRDPFEPPGMTFRLASPEARARMRELLNLMGSPDSSP